MQLSLFCFSHYKSAEPKQDLEQMPTVTPQAQPTASVLISSAPLRNVRYLAFSSLLRRRSNERHGPVNAVKLRRAFSSRGCVVFCFKCDCLQKRWFQLSFSWKILKCTDLARRMHRISPHRVRTTIPFIEKRVSNGVMMRASKSLSSTTFRKNWSKVKEVE